jgi:hypothetical protein
MNTALHAGWSRKNITPHGKKVSLAGQFYTRITTEVDYDLEVTALALAAGKTQLTWAACDLLSIPDILLKDVRTTVAEKNTEIDASKIFLSAIHTHTAPADKTEALPGFESGAGNDKDVLSPEEYHALLVEQISEAVIEANENKVEGCTVYTGISTTATGYCRRGIISNGEAVMYIDTSRNDFVRMEGPDGGPINIMYFRDKENNLLGVVTSVPCTAQVLEHHYYITSDYAGRVRKMLSERYGRTFFYLPLISAAGDLSPRNLVTKDYGLGNRYDKDGADELAARIFEAVVREESRPVESVHDFSCFRTAVKEVKLPGWIPSEEQYKWARKKKDSAEVSFDINDYVQKSEEPYHQSALAESKLVQTILARYEHKDAYNEFTAELCAVRFGNTVWVSNPFELFQEYASRMIAGSKARSLWSIQLSNGQLGYFPTKEAAQAGGYGASLPSCFVDPEPSGKLLVKESIALADSLF